MVYLDGVSTEELQDALQGVEGKEPAQRLIAAIAHKNGIPEEELAEWFDVDPSKVSSWFKRLEQGPLHQYDQNAEAIDGPRKLTDDELDQLASAVDNPPEKAGYDHKTWNPGLIRRYIREQFGVEYPHGSAKRWANKAKKHVRE